MTDYFAKFRAKISLVKKPPLPNEPGYETFRLAGRRYGDLQVIRRDESRNHEVTHWICFCRQCTAQEVYPEWKLERGLVTECARCRAILKFGNLDKS